ncbi:MAG: YfdX family protein, partial [Sulfurovaceae bacterium]|nr:YfdX family protein [Sulfurovaceae bacterium]
MKKIILSTLLTSLLLTNVNSKEIAEKNATVKEVNKIAISNAKEDVNSHKAKLVQEAIASLKEAHDALIALEKQDSKGATKKIENALGKLEVILTAKDSPKLLPINSVISANEFVGKSKDIKVTLELVKSLIDKGKVQEARKLMLPLTSEIDMTIVSLP